MLSSFRCKIAYGTYPRLLVINIDCGRQWGSELLPPLRLDPHNVRIFFRHIVYVWYFRASNAGNEVG